MVVILATAGYMMQIDRQTDRQTDRQIIQTDRQIIQTDRHTAKQKERQTDHQINRYAVSFTDTRARTPIFTRAHAHAHIVKHIYARPYPIRT